MKNIHFRKHPIFILGLFLLLAACGGQTSNEESNTQSTTESEPEQNVDTAAADETAAHINNVLDEYYNLNAALVETDAQKAKSAGAQLAEVLANFEVTAVQEDLQDSYKNISDQIHQHAEKIAQADDIEVQRTSFSDVTAGVYEIVKTFNANLEDVYYAYCPMAFDNTGGYWLSDAKEIRNPYFGSKMLKCGSVKETIAGQ